MASKNNPNNRVKVKGDECPECKSKMIWKRFIGGGKKGMRLVCEKCEYEQTK